MLEFVVCIWELSLEMFEKFEFNLLHNLRRRVLGMIVYSRDFSSLESTRDIIARSLSSTSSYPLKSYSSIL